MTLFCLMYYKYSKAKARLMKSYLILFKKLTHLHGLVWHTYMGWNFSKDNLFGYPKLDCPPLVYLTFKLLFLNKLKRIFSAIRKTRDIGPANPKLHPEHEIIPTPHKVLSSGALRSTPAVHQWILNLSRENFEVVERCLHLASWQASYCEQ
jgi:hypothetical protein